MALELLLFTCQHILLLFLLIHSAAADQNATPAVIRNICGRNVSQNPQDFDVNFVNAMEMIFQNITKSGFGAAISGTSDRVYGLGQCYNYLPSVDCQLCYEECRVKIPHCTPNTTARIYVDGCMLRYADYNMFTEATDESDTFVCGDSQASSSRSALFNDTVIELMGNLTSEAYNDQDYYKAASSVMPGGATVYGVAQCWRSLNRSSCKDCLENARRYAVRCLPATDGKALNAGCFLRYSTDPFYLPRETGTGGSSARRRLMAALASIVATLAVLGIAILWSRRRRRRRRRRSSSSAGSDLDHCAEAIRMVSSSSTGFKYEDLRKATDNFNEVNKVGQGGYGSVYKGILPDDREVAVKRLFLNTRQWIEQFSNEVNLVNQVQHKNLVKLYGCSVDGPESLLVYEYLRNKSLDQFLFDSFRKNELDWGKRLNIIVGTAEGLAYLHSSSQVRIIHRDVKVSNILLDELFRPKVADFGLARYFAEDQSHLSTGLAGTFGYMAPEYIVHGQLTEKADIYSFGIVVLEIITGRKNQNVAPDGRSLVASVWEHHQSSRLLELLDPSLQGQCSEEQVLRAFHVGLLCIQATPSLRPAMRKVVEMLASKSGDLPFPTQPPFLNKSSHNNASEASSLRTSSSNKSPFSMNQLSGSISQGR